MFVNYRSLIASWWGGIGLGTVGAGGYWAYDTKNPRVSQWLLGSGYILNPPELTGNQSKNWDCFENIFKEDSGFEENKLYACGSAFIHAWNNGDQEGKKIDYLTFISEFFIRKENKGWKIKTTFDNRSGDANYVHDLFIYIRNSENKDWKAQKKFFGEVSTDHASAQSNSKELNIKMPNGQWFKSENYSNKISDVIENLVTMPETYESFKEGKSWSGIWVEDSSVSGSWIFQNIEIFIEDKKYSQIFCKQETTNNCYETPDNEDVWLDEEIKVSEIISEIISEIYSSKGKWLDAEKICKVGNKRKRSISAEHQKNLRMFCSKPKNSLLETSN